MHFNYDYPSTCSARYGYLLPKTVFFSKSSHHLHTDLNYKPTADMSTEALKKSHLEKTTKRKLNRVLKIAKISWMAP